MKQKKKQIFVRLNIYVLLLVATDMASVRPTFLFVTALAYFIASWIEVLTKGFLVKSYSWGQESGKTKQVNKDIVIAVVCIQGPC
jgi:hypothetical protein